MILSEIKNRITGSNKIQSQAENCNVDFISKIQPIGGISFKDDRFIKVGDGYEACLYVFGYKKHIQPHWLATLLNINNAVVTLDISTENTMEAKRNINKSMKEQGSRVNNSKDYGDVMDADNQFKELAEMYQEITSMGEVVKLIVTRIYIPGRTLPEIDNQTKEIVNYLESCGYKAAICLNEQKNDWQNMLRPYNKQQQSIFKRVGQPLLSGTLAIGNPFHFTCLNDPMGTYYGQTTNTGGGSVIFDLFQIDQIRMSYNSLIVGKMGSGKSTLLKKIMLDRAIRGDFTRVFDPTGEFAELANYLGGKIISLDGSSGTLINALEILKTDENNNVCYNRHLSKLTTIYKYLNPNCDKYDVITFEEILREIYLKYDLVPASDEPDKVITGLSPESYPTFSELLSYIVSVRERYDSEDITESAVDKIHRIERIELVIRNIVQNYGNIFDGHTSISNITDEQIVVFDIRNLLGNKPEIFDAQLFNALSLCWDNCIAKGSNMKSLYDKNAIAWEDITRFLIIVDEAHRIINSNKTAGVEQVTIYEREARKYFGGIVLASQSIRDFVPDNSDKEGVQMIKTLFELSTYKFIMNQDSNCIEKLSQIFQNQLTLSELQRVPRLSKGETILAISGDKNIEFKIEISEQEDQLFTGGA